MDKFDLIKYVADKKLTSPTPSKIIRKRTPVREAKKSTYETKLAEIEKQGKIVTMEAKINALEEMIEAKNSRLNLVSEDENLSELIDKKKIKEMQKEIKLLEKTKLKLERIFEKLGGVRTEVTSGDTIDEDTEKEMSDTSKTAQEDQDTENVEEGGNLDSNPDPKSFNKKDPDHVWEDEEQYEEDGVSEGGNIDSNQDPKSFLKKEPDYKW